MSTRAQKRLRSKGRSSTDSFVSLPHRLMDSRAFASLSPRATKLLLELAAQYRGMNNGDLSAPLSVLKKRGWNSSDQLAKAKKELIAKGLIIVSRQGGLNRCSLYALTWKPIDDCSGKLDVRATNTASNLWKQWTDSKEGSTKP